MGLDRLVEAHARIQAEARRVAGSPGDIVQRVILHHAIYVDSRGNHAFPLIALHGALWGFGFFETSGKLGHLIGYRYFLDPAEKASRLAMLDRFAEGFKAVNRQVFIDTFTNYWFTKSHGERPGAEQLVRPELLDALNEAHAAARAGRGLDGDRMQHVFVQALRFEQEETVAPAILQEIAAFDCPILKALCLRPMVRFTYFPLWRRFYFRDFSDKAERIEKAIRSFEIAAYRGWDQVVSAMRDYDVLPASFFDDPRAVATRLFGEIRTT